VIAPGTTSKTSGVLAPAVSDLTVKKHLRLKHAYDLDKVRFLGIIKVFG